MTPQHASSLLKFVSKNSPHADEATLPVHIRVYNLASDGHCGGCKRIGARCVDHDFNDTIWVSQIKLDLHMQDDLHCKKQKKSGQ